MNISLTTRIKLVQKAAKVLLIMSLFVINGLHAQTNVYDNIIAQSPEHTYLKAAIDQQGLQSALRDSSANLTVFAPTNAAFNSLAAALNTDIAGLLALSNLTEVLTYHVLGEAVPSDSIRNGQLVTPLNNANTLKLTKTSGGDVFVNQAKVSAANLSADNGLVHVLDAVVLPVETVVDAALDNNFTTLAAAVIKAELLPALSDPFALYTVFAPDNAAFDTLAKALNTDLNGILALPNLKDVLLYHVLGDEVLSTEITAGTTTALNGKVLTLKTSPKVMVNDADVTTADVRTDNGVVHVINKVLVPAVSSVKSVSAPQLTVFPNPTANILSIQGYTDESFEIVNAFGTIVMRGSLNGGSINLEQLAQGQYTLRLSSADTVLNTAFVKL